MRDSEGVVTQEFTYLEPEFDDEQRDWLIAYARYMSEVGPHGFLMSEATSPDADPANPDAKFHFVTRDKPTVDRAEKSRMDAIDAYKQKWPDANLNGLIFRTDKVDL